MTEIFGIFPGSISIASIFSTCVDCFDYIQTSRQFGRDFQTDLLTLSLLKLRLARWGETVQIYDDPKLGQSELSEADLQGARSTLLQILVLFEDSCKVSAKYQLQCPVPTITRDDTDPDFAAVGNKIKELTRRRQKLAGFRKLSSWSLYHKDHYDHLVEGIIRLVDNLEQAYPAPTQKSALIKADMDEIKAELAGKQDDMLALLHSLSSKLDGIRTEEKPVEFGGDRGVLIQSIELTDRAKMRIGDFIGAGWKGEANFPEDNSTISIGSLDAGGESRIMFGNTYNSKDNFWN